jgi:hypothetical protein
MSYARKTIISALVASALCTTSTQAFADSDHFHQSLSKTQKQEHSQAAKELEILGRQLQKRGDLANAYRSQAATSLIRYELDPYRYSTPYTYKGGEQGYHSPEWYHLSSCWSNDQDGFSGGSCNFGIGWVEPPTDIKNFGGIVVFDNNLNTSASKNNVRGILDIAIVPKLRANESVVSSCETTSSVGKKQGVLALVTYNARSKKYTKIRQAWYPDIQAKRFQPIDAKKVTCPIPYDPEG